MPMLFEVLVLVAVTVVELVRINLYVAWVSLAVALGLTPIQDNCVFPVCTAVIVAVPEAPLNHWMDPSCVDLTTVGEKLMCHLFK